MNPAPPSRPPAAPTRAAGRRRHGAGLLAALLVVAVAGCGGGANADEPTDGPLEAVDDGVMRLPQTAGKPFVYGVPIVINTGKAPVVFDRIGVSKLPDGLKVTETYIIGPERKAAIAFERTWPSKTGHYKGIKPVRGYTLAPVGKGKNRISAQLVYVLRADEPGTYDFKSVTAGYHVGDTEHRARMPYGLRACILPKGVKLDLDRCPEQAG